MGALWYVLGHITARLGVHPPLHQIPDLQTHIEVNVRNRRPTVRGVTWAHERISCVFKEHHCLIPDEPIHAPAEAHGWGEDVLNVWLPRRLEIDHEAVSFFCVRPMRSMLRLNEQDGLTLHDPETGKTVFYNTYHPDRENPYSRPFKKSSEWQFDLPTQTISEPEDSQHETDDDYDEVCEELYSGVTDIIITGEVRSSFASG